MAMAAAPVLAEGGAGAGVGGSALTKGFSSGKLPDGLSSMIKSPGGDMGGGPQDAGKSLDMGHHSAPKPSPHMGGSSKEDEDKKELSSPPASPMQHGLDSVKKAADSLLQMANKAETALGAAMGVVQGVTQVATEELGQHSPSRSLKPH